MSVDVAAFKTFPAWTTIDTPGSGSRPLVTRPSTRHDVGDGGAAGCCPAVAPAVAAATHATTSARLYHRREYLISFGTSSLIRYTTRGAYALLESQRGVDADLPRTARSQIQPQETIKDGDLAAV